MTIIEFMDKHTVWTAVYLAIISGGLSGMFTGVFGLLFMRGVRRP